MALTAGQAPTLVFLLLPFRQHNLMEKIISKHLASTVLSQRDLDQILDPSPSTSSICKRGAFPEILDLPWRTPMQIYAKAWNQSNRGHCVALLLTDKANTLNPSQVFSAGLEREKNKIKYVVGLHPAKLVEVQLSCACNIKQGEHLERSIMIINRAISRTSCALEMVL